MIEFLRVSGTGKRFLVVLEIAEEKLFGVFEWKKKSIIAGLKTND